jgi:hypothetical protein
VLSHRRSAGGLGAPKAAARPEEGHGREAGRGREGERNVERVACDQAAARLEDRGRGVELGDGLDPALEQIARDVNGPLGPCIRSADGGAISSSSGVLTLHLSKRSLPRQHKVRSLRPKKYAICG